MKVEIRRSHYLESVHQIEARVETANGEVLFETGEDFLFFPRSVVKPFQAQTLLESGTYKAYGLNLGHLALASASHAGEKLHIAFLTEWLAKLKLQDSDLRCGAHWPYDSDAIHEIHQTNSKPNQLHNNCSGKHISFLNICLHKKWPIEDYHLVDHPLQQSIKKLLEMHLETELESYGIDGCSIPAYRVSFYKLCQAFAKMAEKIKQDTDSSERLIFRAFQEQGRLTAGKEEYCFRVMEKNAGRILVKEGAEGVLVAIIPEKNMSILVKAADGTERASQAAMDFLIERHSDLKGFNPTALVNWAGLSVGDIQIKL